MRLVAQIRRSKGKRIDRIHPSISKHNIVTKAFGIDIVFKFLCGDGCHTGCIIHCARRCCRDPSGHEPFVTAAMVRKFMCHRSDQIKFISNLGLQRKQFTDIHTRHDGIDGFIDSTIIFRSIRLKIVGLHMRRTPGEPNEYDRRLINRRCDCRFRLSRK